MTISNTSIYTDELWQMIQKPKTDKTFEDIKKFVKDLELRGLNESGFTLRLKYKTANGGVKWDLIRGE